MAQWKNEPRHRLWSESALRRSHATATNHPIAASADARTEKNKQTTFLQPSIVRIDWSMRDSDPPSFARSVAIPRFTPVRFNRRRRDGWSPKRQRLFITALARTGCVADAARIAGMGMTSAYTLRRRAGAESFAAAWDKALHDARRRALEIAMQAAFAGTLTPLRYRGNFTGTMVRKDDLRAALAALRTVTLLSHLPPSK